MNDTARTLAALRSARVELTGGTHDYDAIVAQARSSDIVLLGEASHGTHEFYLERVRITQRLIQELGFNAVAAEADWPDAYRVNRYVRGSGDDQSASAALAGFQRFPTWMWRNRVVERFVDWLRQHNATQAPTQSVGFYGLDLYSMHASVNAVLRYLEHTDPDEARRARERYSCFELFGADAEAYGYAATRYPAASCEDAAVQQLVQLQRHAGSYARGGSDRASDEFFHAEQNARLVKNAEEYYRTMYRGGVSSWNLRDRHMCETLYALLDHFARRGIDRPRVVVWAHNSHLGDARATQMGETGEWNVGQLVRERSGSRATSVGFTTHTGTVTAASDWDEPAQFRRVLPALAGSCERLFHELGGERFLLHLSRREVREPLDDWMLERAIGVIYRPETERHSHYFFARPAGQFDFIIHIDTTTAVEPLEPGPRWPGAASVGAAAGTAGEAPETFPTGL